MKKVLVVDDEPSILTLLTFNLEKEGYQVTTSEDGKNGFELALSNQYDFIILDVMLPGMDGLEITKALRREKIDTPILILTAKDEQVDKIIGLEIGADDYLTKPFSPAELVARIKSHMLRYERLSGNRPQLNIISHKALEIRTDSHKVFVNGKEVILTTKEYELMVFLASNPNIVFTKDQLFDRIWGDDYYGDTATVAVHIQKLRKKIEKDPGNPEYIETLWGTGYRFNS